ncbi:TLC domain-containing protein [Boletus edulis]|uniref:Longevity assurance proteins LAG1/LAC1 n=1 Tax=Boletus edulis BED1 TaxID=1328754 RepID=A0AAD4C6B3_BOLED|nr:TLC domain-containing protein [Boletus edulis]KAF8450454.1 longevity assurance proteins LAG1/LAC1 [Boletus edulis BED1]
MNSLQASDWLPFFLVPFFTLSYPTTPPANPDSFHDSQYYTTGILDACVIVSCIAVMAVLRDMTRIYLMEPFAKWKLTRDWERSQRAKIKLKANGAPNGSVNGSPITNGVASHKNGEYVPLTLSKRDARKIHRSMLRFAEQGWSFIYYAVNFAFGVYVHHHLPTRVLDPIDLWLNYPHIPLAGTVKFYYLTQTAFYLHQVLILNAEARRKDHVQMMAHHIITIILMVTSYTYNFTRIGCVIMVLMDCCDIFLPLAKMLRYIALYTLCDAMFTAFLVCWFITRHVLFIIVIKSVWVDSPRLVREMWAPERGSYLSPLAHKTFIALLVSLQVLQIVWFGMICRVAYRVVTGHGASDDRSDEEDG